MERRHRATRAQCPEGGGRRRGRPRPGARTGTARPCGGTEEHAHGNSRSEKKRFSLFGRRKKREREFNEEDDLYYGLQLKPLEEYRKEYEQTIQIDRKEIERESGETSNFPYLFDEKKEGPTPEMTEAFEKIHRERHERLEKIMEKAGLDPDEILSEAPGPKGPGKEMPPPRRNTVPAPREPAQPRR